MSNWLKHVKETMLLHPGKPLKEVLKVASKTYKKGKETVGKAMVLRKSRSKKHRRRRRHSRKRTHKKKKSRRHRRHRRHRRRGGTCKRKKLVGQKRNRSGKITKHGHYKCVSRR